MATQSHPAIRDHGKDPEDIRRFLDVLVPSFYEDPLFKWMFRGLTDEQRHQKLWIFLKPIIMSAPVVGGYLLDASDWGAVMAVGCPGQKYDSVPTILKCGAVPAIARCGVQPAFRLLVEYFSAVDKVKEKGIRSSSMYDCFYIMITATHESRRKQGLNSALMLEMMERAKRVNKPIWLEATTAYSRRQYERLGFEVVGEIVVGKGKVNRDGVNEKGGAGVMVTGMVWSPDTAKNVALEKEVKEVNGNEVNGSPEGNGVTVEEGNEATVEKK